MAYDFASNLYQNPGMRQETSLGATDTRGFFTPNDSQLMPGGRAGLLQYLTEGGALSADQMTNRTVKYDGGLTREMMGNGFGQISGQIGNQMGGIEDLFNQYGSLGGLGGIQNGGNTSAVYRPQGQVFTAGMAQQQGNGQQLPFASNNPFNATF